LVAPFLLCGRPNGSISPTLAGPRSVAIRPATLRGTSAGPASHPDMRSGGPPPRMSSRCPHAGFPQGFLTRRNLISSRVWLTNAIDRIVKECKAVRPRPWRFGRRTRRAEGPSVNWPSLDHRDSMLAAGVRCRCDILPGRRSGIRFLGEAEAILTVSRPRSTTRRFFFKTRFSRPESEDSPRVDSTLSAGLSCLLSISPRPFPSSFTSARQET